MRTISGVPGFSFGGVHSGDFGIYLVSKKPDLLPKTRDYEQVIFGKNGQYDLETQLDQRLITLVLRMNGNSREDLIENLSAFAALIDPRKGYQKLIFDDDPARYYLAKYTSASTEPVVDYIINRADFTLGLKCDDPLIYAIEPKTITWQAQQGINFTVTNYGTDEIPLIFKIKAPSEESINGLTISINGVSVTYTDTIGPDDIVEIDTGEFTFAKNGVNAIQFWEGDFPKLQPGINTLTASVAANITLIYQERWVG